MIFKLGKTSLREALSEILKSCLKFLELVMCCSTVSLVCFSWKKKCSELVTRKEVRLPTCFSKPLVGPPLNLKTRS